MEIPEAIARQAAEWILLLDEGDAEQQARVRRDFQTWQDADPLHAKAAHTAQAFIGKLTALKTAPIPARDALGAGLRHHANHRKLLRATLMGLVLVPLFFIFLPFIPFDADLRTTSGEWKNHTLADGSRITMAGRGEVDIHFDETRREVRLRSGEIYVDVAKDARRPFIVSSKFGRIEALGTRFIVNHHQRQTRLTMLESSVRVMVDSPQSSSTVVRAGEQLTIDARGLGRVEHIVPALRDQAWRRQQLVVRAWPLADVLRELARYHPGFLYFDEANLPAISVSAVLPLDKPEQALQLLVDSFPAIHITTRTPWVTVVEAKKNALVQGDPSFSK